MGGGVLLGVRVQVGMGVREAVGVKESMAMKVLLRSVQIASAVKVPRYGGVREGVARAVAVDVGWKMDVNSVAEVVTVNDTVEVTVAASEGVEESASIVGGTSFWERTCSISDFPNASDPMAKIPITREKASHCLPVCILA